jgi:hypothetical protein
MPVVISRWGIYWAADWSSCWCFVFGATRAKTSKSWCYVTRSACYVARSPVRDPAQPTEPCSPCWLLRCPGCAGRFFCPTQDTAALAP